MFVRINNNVLIFYNNVSNFTIENIGIDGCIGNTIIENIV